MKIFTVFGARPEAIVAETVKIVGMDECL